MTEAIPNIDLGGKVAVIDDSTDPPHWRTIGRCYATEANAKRILQAAGLRMGWLIDDLGYRKLISI